MRFRGRRHAGAIAAALLVAVFGACAPVAPPAIPPAEAATGVEVGRVRNPVLAAADPHAAVFGDRYWLYATTPEAAGSPRRARLYAYESPDLRSWRRRGPIFTFDGVDWIDDDGAPRHFLWAPAVLRAGGRYVLYYSVGPQNPTPSRLGVAVGESPAGPFRDSGRPLLTGGDGFEAIDPMVFLDPATGTAYLYVGGSAGARLRVFELEPSMTAIRREVPIAQPPNFTEGPFMHVRDGVYYLSYSHGRWYDASYSAHYATAPGPTGPWTYRGAILTSDRTRKGPGHHSIVQNPVSKAWFIVYHRWERTGDGPFEGDRQVAIQSLTYRADGAIEPVRMDDAPPPASPIGAASARPAPAESSRAGTRVGALEEAGAVPAL